MSTVPADAHGSGEPAPSDSELITAVRGGTVSAYGQLYERHVGAAYNLARQLSRSPAEADDLVSEAFAKVLDTLRAGRGPDVAFRAYLLTALRHTAYDKTRRDRRVEVADDVSTVSGVKPTDVSVQFSDTAVAGLERSLAARAFARLPERWQAVLWHTEIEGQSPAEVAPIFGMTPNSVSALAYRAREGLRQAYLQVHLAESLNARCRATADRLGAWTRSGLSKREKAQVEHHLDECDQCRALAAELSDVNAGMRAFVAPLVLGTGVLGYLAAAGSAKAVAAGAAVGGTVAAAGAAAGASGSSAGSAVGLLIAAPRQLVGVAASTAALATAVVLGLSSGSTGAQLPPVAGQTNEPSVVERAPRPTEPTRSPTDTPAPGEPVRSPAAGSAAPTTNPASPSPPASVDPTAPAVPTLVVSGPDGPVALTAGGSPADLPITVRNTGAAVSEPVSATLGLPPGVRAVSGGPSRFAPVALLRLNAAQPSTTVGCPPGTGTVTCASQRGLAPGETVVLMFRLIARPDSTGGTITGTVSAGSSISVPVSVPVTVDVLSRPAQPPRPPRLDGVALQTHTRYRPGEGAWHRIRLDIVATNTGTSTGPLTVTVDRPTDIESVSPPMSCVVDATTRCTTAAPATPRGEVTMLLRLDPEPARGGCGRAGGTVRVVAAVGTATATRDVRVAGCAGGSTAPSSGPVGPDPLPPALAPARRAHTGGRTRRP